MKITRAVRRQLTALLVLVVGLVGLGTMVAAHATLTPSSAVPAADETNGFPVATTGDIADDPWIWRDDAQPDRSVVVVTNKGGSGGGLGVYDMNADRIQYLQVGALNNVDGRQNVLGGDTILAASNRTNNTLTYFRFDPATRTVAVAGSTAVGFVPYGVCMGVADNGDLTVVVTQTGVAGTTQLDQYRLTENSSNGIVGTKVRDMTAPSVTEGCVIDEATNGLFVGEENRGLFRYSSEPSGANTRTTVDVTGSGGNLVTDVEGVDVVRTSDGGEYIVVSSQGESRFNVYDLAAPHAFRKDFSVAASTDGTVDAASSTDGLDVDIRDMGPNYPNGLLVVHDNANTGDDHSNVKYVDASLVFGASDTSGDEPPPAAEEISYTATHATGGVVFDDVLPELAGQPVTLRALAWRSPGNRVEPLEHRGR